MTSTIQSGSSKGSGCRASGIGLIFGSIGESIDPAPSRIRAFPPSTSFSSLSPVTLSPPLVEHVCSEFDLGTPAAAWRPVSGGLSNELYRLETQKDAFAIKRMIAGTEFAAFEGNVEASFAIERAAVALGVHAPAPVSPRNTERCLAEIECEDGSPCWVRVHRWMEGSTPSHLHIEPQVAHQLGGLMAAVHGLEVPAQFAGAANANDAGPSVGVVGEQVWHELDQRAQRAAPPWSADYSALRSVIHALEARIQAHVRGVVAGHRDPDDKNTLLDPNARLALIDWDAAGPVIPIHELTSLLIDWSGAKSGEPRMEIVRAIREGYAAHASSPAILEQPLDASGWIDAQLGWLERNLLRALGDFEPGDVAAGERELVFFSDHLARMEHRLDAWLEGFGQDA